MEHYAITCPLQLFVDIDADLKVPPGLIDFSIADKLKDYMGTTLSRNELNTVVDTVASTLSRSFSCNLTNKRCCD